MKKCSTLHGVSRWGAHLQSSSSSQGPLCLARCREQDAVLELGIVLSLVLLWNTLTPERRDLTEPSALLRRLLDQKLPEQEGPGASRGWWKLRRGQGMSSIQLSHGGPLPSPTTAGNLPFYSLTFICLTVPSPSNPLLYSELQSCEGNLFLSAGCRLCPEHLLPHPA